MSRRSVTPRGERGGDNGGGAGEPSQVCMRSLVPMQVVVAAGASHLRKAAAQAAEREVWVLVNTTNTDGNMTAADTVRSQRCVGIAAACTLATVLSGSRSTAVCAASL